MSVATRISRMREPQTAFFFTCKWGFTPEAKDVIQTRFGNELQRIQLTAHLSYDYENYLFTATQFSCRISVLYEVFQKVINDFILEQLGEDSEYGEIQSNLMFRIAPLLSGDENQVEGPSEGHLIEDECRIKWSCPRIELFVEQIFHETLLRQIGKLTDCTLSYDGQSRKILIVGSFEVDCHRTIQKLEKIRDNDIPLLTNPLMNNDHCFWAEEEENFAPVLLPLKTIHTLYETTLIDVTKYDHGNCYQDLAKGGTVRCCLFAPVSRRYKPIPAKKPDPAVKAANKDDKSKVFAKYKYSSKGDDVDNPMNRVDPADHHGPSSLPSWIPAEKKTRIERWVGDLPKDNPLPPDTVSVRKPSMSSALIVDYVDEPHIFSSDNFPIGNIASAINRSPSRSSKYVSQAVSSINVSVSQNTSLLDTDLDDIPLLSALMPVIEPIRPGNIPVHNSMVEEKLQKDSEVESREYHTTMRQKASRGGWDGDRFIPPPPPNYLIKPFIDQLEASTLKILDAMRSWPGEVKLVAQFGRAWVNRYSHRQFASDSAHMPWLDANKFSRKLLEIDNGRPIVDMTDLLTTLPADIQYLVDLAMLEGNPYWNPRPTWSISYQFQCRDLNPTYLNERFMLEVDAESFAYKVHTLPQRFGDCYVHCLKRNWDYRISGTGTKDLASEYESFAEDLVRTLYIPKGTDDSTLRMSFELDLHHSFAFHTVRVAKKSTYTSYDGKSKLNIVEFRDMGIKLHVIPAGESNRHIYEVWAQTARDNISYKECSWFEVSILSTKAEQYFEQNKGLEIREETPWRKQDFQNHDLLAALYRPACAMIRQMDGVGYFNDNPFGAFLRENEETWRAEKEKEKKQNEMEESD